MTGGDAGDPRAAVLHSGRVQYRFNRNGVHDGPEYAPPRYVGDATVLSPLELLMPARISRPMFRFALDIDLLLDPELDIDAVRAALAEAQNSHGWRVSVKWASILQSRLPLNKSKRWGVR